MAVMAKRTPWILRGMARLAPGADRAAEQLPESARSVVLGEGFGNPSFGPPPCAALATVPPVCRPCSPLDSDARAAGGLF